MTPIIHAAAYIRVSTQEQKLHGLSLDAQRMKLTEYAQANNLEIVKWYADEGVSGRKVIAKRPQLQAMIADAEAGKFERIIFIKLDRFFRSVAEYHECMKRLGNVLWTATEEKYDLTTANGRMFVNMKLTIAEMEADQTGERIKLVHEYKAKAGIAMMGTVRLPFCYENPTGQEGKRVLHKRNEAAMLDLIDYIDSHHSIRGGMVYINDKYGLNLTYRQVSTALRSPLLCGQYRDNLNYCEPYMTREHFARMQEALSHGQRTTDTRAYIFQGLIHCPKCGRIMNGAQHNTVSQKGKYRYHYSSYRCPAHRISKTCSFAGSVFEKTMEEKVIACVENELAIYHAAASVQASSKPNTKRIDELKAELYRIQYAWEKGRLSPEDYDRKYDDAKERIAKAEEEYKQANKPSKKILTELPASWKAAYLELSAEGKRDFWKSFISEIHIDWNSGKTAKKEIEDIVFI